MTSPLAARLAAALLAAGAQVAGSAQVEPAVAHVAPAAEATHHGQAARTEPRTTRRLYVDPTTSAARAAQADPTFDSLASAPQALWLTSAVPTGDVRRTAQEYADRADAVGRTPLLALYAIPDRDCSGYSSGGLPGEEEYVAWVREVARGLRGRHAIVVLEPDAIPFFDDPRCRNAGDRLGLLRRATRLLDGAGAWVYLDAGHSGWRTPEHIAPLLKRAGIASARGFSTNVANFVRTGAERAYARAVTGELARIGAPGTHYVIETARNGARPAPATGDVCNPTAARVGRRPGLVFRGALDGYLWVKHPGESDGQSWDGACHGGPPAGQWWPAGARRLLAD